MGPGGKMKPIWFRQNDLQILLSERQLQKLDAAQVFFNHS
jgi:hypothetical protein